MTQRAIELAIAALAVGAIASTQPSPELAFFLQFCGVGGIVGVLVALVRHGRDPDADRWWITAVFTAAGGALALVFIVIDALR